jgi:succinate dehydrogenase/fumarate reductase flavoprotein subunit
VNSIPRNVRANIIKRLKGTHWQGNDFGPLLKWLDEGYAIEVAPAAHYFEGGIHIQPNCETNIPGLFAAGECAAGVFGANRVAAATTEMIIEGHLAGASAAQFAKKNELGKDPLRLGDLIFEKVTTPLNRSKGLRPTELKNHVQLLASNNLWVIRDEKGMNRLLAEIQSLKEGLKDLSIPGKNHLPFNKEWITALELQNLIPMLEVTAHAALKRTESRGVHYRTDYPQTDFDHWNCNLVARNLNGIPALTRKDLNITAVNIPKGKVDYLESIKMAIQALETC